MNSEVTPEEKELIPPPSVARHPLALAVTTHRDLKIVAACLGLSKKDAVEIAVNTWVNGKKDAIGFVSQ